jgi:hypothetical protein
MQSFCLFCGEYHPPGKCLEFDPPPQKKPDAEKNQGADRQPEEEGPAIIAQDQGREVFQCEARRFTPEDMKQEAMPDYKPRFDRNAYQRELMRRRRTPKENLHDGA